MTRTAAVIAAISKIARVARLWCAVTVVSLPGASHLAAQPLPVDDAFDVNQFATSFQLQPAVRMASSGAAVFAWHSDGQDGSEKGVVARKMASNGSFFNEFLFNQTTAGNQDFPNLAMNASGDFAVTFRNGPITGRDVILRSTFTNGSSLGNEVQANTTAGNMLESAICRFDDDTSVVVWANPFLVHRRFAANGTATSSEVPYSGISDPGDPAVACLSNQRFVAVWSDLDDDGAGIFAVLVNNLGSQVGAPFRVNEDPDLNQREPRVTSDGASRFVVAWKEETEAGNRVELRRFFVEPAAVPPVALGGDEFVAQVALNINMGNVNMASDGAFVVAYDDASELNSARALEFTRTGVALPGGPAIPSDTTSINIDAGVGLREYLLAWEAPGVSSDIRARRYVRRAVFSDDFETAGSEGWSAVAP